MLATEARPGRASKQTIVREVMPSGRGALLLVSVLCFRRLTVIDFRLDEMHAGINEYLGNRLSLADIGDPKRILEIGYGILTIL